MIRARKSAWFERLFAVYNRNLIGRRFVGLRVAGLESIRDRPRDAPLILYANHSSWWDGLVAFQIGRALALDQYAMMEERHLREYPFHRRLGAFSVVRENARAALLSIEHAGDLLRGTARVLWIFPQGVTLPNDVRPLRLYMGAAHIIKQTGNAYVAPVAMRYEFLDDFRPDILVRVGEVERIEAGANFDVKQMTNVLTENLTSTLDRVRADIIRRDIADYEEIVAPRRRSSGVKSSPSLSTADKGRPSW
ncbi:MAG TPA: lysophospholipid acyltransferase family protein [Pyrinomonadaceae bacterium]|nr:lysophospholipid acyltransferase family protein [Pyrinomonadaceae bacterium]